MADNSNSFGSFIASTNIWDTSEIFQIDVNSIEFKELLVRLYQNLNNIALVLNTKETGIYQTRMPFVNGQSWFPNPNLNTPAITNVISLDNRQGITTVLFSGPLPNTGTLIIPHNITCNGATTFTEIYGTASDTTGFNYIPLGYPSPILANNIELRVDNTNVYITTGSNRSNFNIVYVVLKYLLN